MMYMKSSMDCASSFAAYTSERNFDDDSRSSESGTDTGTDSALTDGSNTSFLFLKGKSPLTSGGRVIDVNFTPKQSNRLSLLKASAATKKMLQSTVIHG